MLCRVKMINLCADGQPAGVVRTLGRGCVRQTGPFNGARLIGRHGLSLHSRHTFNVIFFSNCRCAIAERMTQFCACTNFIDQFLGIVFAAPVHQSCFGGNTEGCANFDRIQTEVVDMPV